MTSDDLPKGKIKRRKVKQPAAFTVEDGDVLRIVFKKDSRTAFWVLASMAGIFTIGMVISLFEYAMGRLPIYSAFSFTAVALLLFYMAVVTEINKTYIVLDENKLTVTYEPLPTFAKPIVTCNVSVANIVKIYYEERLLLHDTSRSRFGDKRKNAHDELANYLVYVELKDVSLRTIASDLPEDYAIFITQCLSERLDTATPDDASHFEDDDLHITPANLQSTDKTSV